MEEEMFVTVYDISMHGTAIKERAERNIRNIIDT